MNNNKNNNNNCDKCGTPNAPMLWPVYKNLNNGKFSASVIHLCELHFKDKWDAIKR